MSESKRKMNKQQKFLATHSICYFCGGINRATTIDHVPPRSCFPNGYAPEGFEFPACKECNEGSTKQDLVFGFYSMFLDFDEFKMTREEDLNKFNKLKQGIINNYPEALPDISTASPIHQVGSIISTHPVAVSIDTNPTFKEAVHVIGQKLTHALYWLECGKILSTRHNILSSIYQPQRGETDALTSYFKSLLPDEKIGNRNNIKDYGNRFRYISGYKAVEDFFLYAAQFGQGIILWGIVCEPDVAIPKVEPLKSASWTKGAAGLKS